MQAYCVKCRAKREIKGTKAITMKDGRPATQGVCPNCGAKLFRIGTFPPYAHSFTSSDKNSDDDYGDPGDSGHTPNDDRSDSMNPNNDAYQASMDNRSDQMNPNNDAYWSSRGR